MSLTRKWIPSPNYSSRGGSAVRLIVIHTAEGATTIESLGNFFKNPSSQVSSHVGADDKKGVIGEYVKRGNKAWTAANANPVAVQIELCAFAKWSTAEWNKHPNMLDNCARWIAEESKAFGIPITWLNSQQAQGSGRGVTSHNNLGSWGGGHWDPGGSFPQAQVLDLARKYAGQSGGGGGGSSDMGYPQWFWDWAQWYYTTDRDPKKRPAAAPQKIPQWAWDGGEDLDRIAKRKGMTSGEKEWMDWLRGGKKGPRPKVPETIPPFWWNDNEYVIAQS